MSLLIFDDYDSSHLIECVIEVYHCSFCKFKESHRDSMQNHYYFNHEKELNKLPGNRLDRKIDILIINGEKSFVKSYL
jgi:hypothetical protein